MPALGPWEPLTPAAVRALFAGAGFSWWIAGGWSLDLLVGRQTRRHTDIDVTVLRPDIALVRARFATWDLHVADPPGSGTLRPWPVGAELTPELHDVWCRRAEGEPWRVQIMIDDVEREEWVYRRDARIRRPLAALRGRASYPDMPVLSPEIQLLYKSKGQRGERRGGLRAGAAAPDRRGAGLAPPGARDDRPGTPVVAPARRPALSGAPALISAGLQQA